MRLTQNCTSPVRTRLAWLADALARETDAQAADAIANAIARLEELAEAQGIELPEYDYAMVGGAA